MPSDYERAYNMALAAHEWGFSHEPAEDYAERIAKIGAADGVMAAATAISDECNASGLQMSPQRVLKNLVYDEGQVRRAFSSERHRSSAGSAASRKLDYSPPAAYHEKKRTERGFAIAGCWLGVVAVVAAVIAVTVFVY